MSLILSGKALLDVASKLSGNYKEKKELDVEIKKLINDYNMKLLKAESEMMKIKSSNINKESNSTSWIKSNWRPVTMLSFVALIILDSFGILSKPLSPIFFELVKLGLGGYVIGRSAEKIIPNVISSAIKKKGIFR